MRSSKRHRVRLRVRYAKAADFVQEYAENLSSGGLFIRDAGDLSPFDIVTVELELPGFGTFRVQGEVAHVLDADVARRFARSAGAGIAITQTPMGFENALTAYLRRLGTRRDHLVWVGDSDWIAVLRDAGYQSDILPSPERLLVAIEDSPALAVVVPPERYLAYAELTQSEGMPEVIALDPHDEVDSLLASLDRLLPN